MSKKAENTGLGRKSFFNKQAATVDDVAVEDMDAATPTGTEEKITTVEPKMRTSVMLSPEVVAGIEALRMEARRKGMRITTSKIVEDAVKILMREKRIAP